MPPVSFTRRGPSLRWDDGSGEEFRVDDDAAADQVRDSRPERNHGPPPVGLLDLQDVARAEILDRDDPPQRLARRALAGEADQVGVIIFAFLQRRQRRAGDGEQLPAKGFGGAPVGDFGEPGDGGAVAFHRSKGEEPLPDPHLLVALQAVGAFGEQFQAHLAAYAMRSGNGGEGDLIFTQVYSAFSAPSAGAASSEPSAGSLVDTPSLGAS